MRAGFSKRLRKGRKNKLASGRDLAILYKIPRSTLSDRLRGIPSRHEAQRKHRAISPAVERSLIRWVDDMDASGFPPRLNLFKATAARLVSEDEGPPLGSTWLRGFLNRHPELSSKFASGLNRQHALSSKPGPIKDYFQKLQMPLRKHNFLPNNIYNMDEKGVLLGMSNRAKVIVRRGRQPA